jgi:hypothetical protein
MLLLAEPKFSNERTKKDDFLGVQTLKLSTWLITKFGVALGICNRISLGWGTRELKKEKNDE